MLIVFDSIIPILGIHVEESETLKMAYAKDVHCSSIHTSEKGNAKCLFIRK